MPDMQFVTIRFSKDNRVVTVAYSRVSPTVLRFGASIFHSTKGDVWAPECTARHEATAAARYRVRPGFVTVTVITTGSLRPYYMRELFRHVVRYTDAKGVVRFRVGGARIDRADRIARREAAKMKRASHPASRTKPPRGPTHAERRRAQLTAVSEQMKNMLVGVYSVCPMTAGPV